VTAESINEFRSLARQVYGGDARGKAGAAARTRAVAHQYPERGVRATAPAARVRGQPHAAYLRDEAKLGGALSAGHVAAQGRPAEIADVIAFLVSARARFITLASSAIDGGLTQH
jgi:3-oxoacyl-[acyl-carrier protein] reductase